MYTSKGSKTAVSLLGTGVTNGATVTANIDTLGFDHAKIELILGTADVVSNTPSVCKLGESNDTVVTNFSDITAFVAGTSAGNFTLSNADTSNPNVIRFDVDCKARKRYLRLTVSPRTTQQAVMVASLDRAEQTPTTAALAGCNTIVNG
jgi:hypothetical protein